MAFQASARSKRGGSVGIFADNARDALHKAEEYLEDGLTEIVFRDENGKLIEFEAMQQLAKR